MPVVADTTQQSSKHLHYTYISLSSSYISQVGARNSCAGTRLLSLQQLTELKLTSPPRSHGLQLDKKGKFSISRCILINQPLLALRRKRRLYSRLAYTIPALSCVAAWHSPYKKQGHMATTVHIAQRCLVWSTSTSLRPCSTSGNTLSTFRRSRIVTAQQYLWHTTQQRIKCPLSSLVSRSMASHQAQWSREREETQTQTQTQTARFSIPRRGNAS